MGSILFGICGVAFGSFMIIKTPSFVEAFGRSAWAEDKLGPGGTYLFIKLLGLALIVVALLAATGMLGGILLGILRPLFGGLA